MGRKSEDQPISNDELLLRRVHVTRFDNKRIPIISPSAFEPRVKGNDPDLDGISLYRLDCLESPHDALSMIQDEAKRKKSGVVGLQVVEVQQLESMKLTVKADRDEKIPGHVVIPELNAKEYAQDKEKFKLTLLELAIQASQPDRILIAPVSED